MSNKPSILFYTSKGKKIYLKVSFSSHYKINLFDKAEKRESATIFYNEEDLLDAYNDAKQKLHHRTIGFELLYPEKTPPDPSKKLQPVTPKPLDVS
jgi:hypothetical protein